MKTLIRTSMIELQRLKSNWTQPTENVSVSRTKKTFTWRPWLTREPKRTCQEALGEEMARSMTTWSFADHLELPSDQLIKKWKLFLCI